MDKLELSVIKEQMKKEFEKYEYFSEYQEILDYELNKVDIYSLLIEFEIQEFLEKLLFKKQFCGKDFFIDISTKIQKQLQILFCKFYELEEIDFSEYDFYDLFDDGFCLSSAINFISCTDINYNYLLDYYFKQFEEEYKNMQIRLQKIIIIFWGESCKYRVQYDKNIISLVKTLDKFQNYLIECNK